MTIRKGQDWGAEAPRPVDLVVIEDDAALHRFAERTGGGEASPPPMVVRSGALARTVGVTTRPVDVSAPVMRLLPIDRLRVELDGVPHWSFAHVVARRTWWRGEVVMAMNAQYLDRWDVAPRSHPNDGRVDVLEIGSSFGLRQRIQARSRLTTGTHVPHPGISERRVREVSWTFASPMGIWLDGVRTGRARRLSITVEPDVGVIAVS